MTKEAQERAAMLVDQHAVQQEQAMMRLREVIGELDPEAGDRLDKAGRGRIPNSWKMPNETVTFLAESLAAVAEAVSETRKPRPRGRPPKDKVS